MQKQFLHEYLRNPRPIRSDPYSNAFYLFRIFCESHFLFRKSSLFSDLDSVPCDAFPQKYMEMACAKFARDDIQVNPTNLGYMYRDPGMQALSLMSSFFIQENPRSFVLAKEFWPILNKTKLNSISWNMLPRTFAGTFRFPEPIIDKDGDPIHEVMIAIQPREVIEGFRRKAYTDIDGEGSRVLMMWWVCADAGGSSGFNVQLIPDGEAPIIPETWSARYHTTTNPYSNFSTRTDEVDTQHDNDHVISMIKALFYVCSGNPDIRSERNKIIYKPKTLDPIASHREFSLLNYELVGWNWMKKIQERRYSKDGWMVEPFARYQPYGPRETPSYRWIIVEGHERHRRKDLINDSESTCGV